jgi:hypothetical protein
MASAGTSNAVINLPVGQLFDRYASAVYYPPAKPDPLAKDIMKLTGIQYYTGDGMSFTGLRTQFRITKTIQPIPAQAEIVVTNLADNTRHNMQDKGGQIVLTAGYKDNNSVIFKGTVRTIDHMHTESDWNTVLKSGDGENSFQYGFSNISMKGFVTAQAACDALAEDTGLGIGNLDSVLSTWTPANGFKGWNKGFHYFGNSSRKLTLILGTLGLTWSVQDGQIQVLPPYTSTNDPYYRLGQDSGLLGSPEHGSPDARGIKNSIVKAKCLLLPQLKIGMRVYLDSREHKGPMSIIRMVHTGDSMGQDWFTNLEMRPTNSPYLPSI